VKLNVDAVMGNNSASLVVVARGEDGEVVKAWTKLFQLDDPLVVEASAVPLALQLLKMKIFKTLLWRGTLKFVWML
jgi:hypothetical protein